MGGYQRNDLRSQSIAILSLCRNKDLIFYLFIRIYFILPLAIKYFLSDKILYPSETIYSCTTIVNLSPIIIYLFEGVIIIYIPPFYIYRRVSIIIMIRLISVISIVSNNYFEKIYSYPVLYINKFILGHWTTMILGYIIITVASWWNKINKDSMDQDSIMMM